MSTNAYGNAVESHDEFMEKRQEVIVAMSNDKSLHTLALELQVAATTYQYGYQQLWCGVPIIRLPDDIILLQEIVFALRPASIIETGIARGGSLILNASLMEICGVTPRVLGIDLHIFDHAKLAIAQSKYSSMIELVQCDSTSDVARQTVEEFVRKSGSQTPCLLILDSNHSHSHVLNELRTLTTCLPIGSIVVVADTIISEMPSEHYSDRPWDKTKNPLSALKEFLATVPNFEVSTRWARRGLLSEMRDGVIVKTS